MPRLLETRSSINVWSAGCSTGEEPYSLMMLLAKQLPVASINILATDIDYASIQVAQKGRYSQQQLNSISTYDREHFFNYINSSYFIKDEYRNQVTFKIHDLLKDTYPVNLDVIVCRNVLIYFTEAAKKDIYKKFSNALKSGGILLIGSTEKIITYQEYHLDTEEMFFYIKRSTI